MKVIEEGTGNRLDGLVPAVLPAASSKKALKRMEGDNLTKLPVVDEARGLIGSVEPDKLT